MGFVETLFRKNPRDVNKEDIENFISRKIEENLNLEYKDIKAYIDFDELSKDVSAFANSDGGLLILGIIEERISKGKQLKIYPKEITWGEETLSKERLEDNIISKIRPRINGLKIFPIREENGSKKVIFLLDIPKSNDSPHMASDNRYYKRLNFRRNPMEHYEVSELFRFNWLIKKEIISEIIQPIYGEISTIIEKIPSYLSLSLRFRQLLQERKYQFDQIDKILREKIINFFERAEKYNKNLNDVKVILPKVSSKFASLYFEADKRIGNLQYNIVSNIRGHTYQLTDPLLKRKKPRPFFKELYPDDKIEKEILEITTQNGDRKKLPLDKEIEDTFERMWKSCLLEAKQESLITSFWNEIDELPKLGEEILKEIKRRY